jgi:hypothetical protein
LVDQNLKLDRVAESWRIRRVKEEAGGFSSISASFGPTGPIHPGNPGVIIGLPDVIGITREGRIGALIRQMPAERLTPGLGG